MLYRFDAIKYNNFDIRKIKTKHKYYNMKTICNT